MSVEFVRCRENMRVPYDVSGSGTAFTSLTAAYLVDVALLAETAVGHYIWLSKSRELDSALWITIQDRSWFDLCYTYIWYVGSYKRSSGPRVPC